MYSIMFTIAHIVRELGDEITLDITNLFNASISIYLSIWIAG